MRDGEVVQRRIEEGERGTLAGTVQRGARGDLVSPLDIGRRQRAQRARHLGHAEIRQVTLFERDEPVGEAWRHGTSVMTVSGARVRGCEGRVRGCGVREGAGSEGSKVRRPTQAGAFAPAFGGARWTRARRRGADAL